MIKNPLIRIETSSNYAYLPPKRVVFKRAIKIVKIVLWFSHNHRTANLTNQPQKIWQVTSILNRNAHVMRNRRRQKYWLSLKGASSRFGHLEKFVIRVVLFSNELSRNVRIEPRADCPFHRPAFIRPGTTEFASLTKVRHNSRQFIRFIVFGDDLAGSLVHHTEKN